MSSDEDGSSATSCANGNRKYIRPPFHEALSMVELDMKSIGANIGRS